MITAIFLTLLGVLWFIGFLAKLEYNDCESYIQVMKEAIFWPFYIKR